jgi:hypothetical protein
MDDVRHGTGTKSRGTVNSNECGLTVTPEPALIIHYDALHYGFGIHFISRFWILYIPYIP